ncbi:Lar-like restriction alleviation protein [Achromobacter phage JWAlpha]|uniref:Restriction alleviation protein n=1 Tax=Achromobacter phage JWAlpha TaxID=1416009 RepID=V9VCU4_9CAUD|nr:Lar-like restriction alleviation protein [Achromobacter phage JWAlpha]AHC93977.1 hypothetical protein JJJB_0024 [Achromobacter phage JWAlpha]
MNTSKLKPCPFCGGEAFSTYKTGDDDICRHSVHCHNRCGAQTGSSLRTHYSEEDAVNAWNMRAPVADESPMAKMADALREKARQEQQAYQDSRVQSTEWGPMPHGTEADLPASAPVAVLSDEDIREVFLAHGFTVKEGQTDLKPYVYVAARALLAQYAAPQASEAVRDEKQQHARALRVLGGMSNTAYMNILHDLKFQDRSLSKEEFDAFADKLADLFDLPPAQAEQESFGR